MHFRTTFEKVDSKFVPMIRAAWFNSLKTGELKGHCPPKYLIAASDSISRCLEYDLTNIPGTVVRKPVNANLLGLKFNQGSVYLLEIVFTANSKWR